MDPAELERLLDGELSRLPRPRAPHTLLPRVLAATSLRHAAGTATGWSTWPRAWQAGGLALVLALAAAIAWLVAAPPRPLGEMTERAGETAVVVRVLWDVLLQPAAAYLAVLGVALTLACAAVWAALEVALGGASHR